MARFLAPDAFSAATEDISLLPFNLERTGTNQYLVANMVGDFVRLTEDELNRLVDLRVRPGDGLYEKAYAAHLITGSNQTAASRRTTEKPDVVPAASHPAAYLRCNAALRTLLSLLPGLPPKHRPLAL